MINPMGSQLLAMLVELKSCCCHSACCCRYHKSLAVHTKGDACRLPSCRDGAEFFAAAAFAFAATISKKFMDK